MLPDDCYLIVQLIVLIFIFLFRLFNVFVFWYLVVLFGFVFACCLLSFMFVVGILWVAGLWYLGSLVAGFVVCYGLGVWFCGLLRLGIYALITACWLYVSICLLVVWFGCCLLLVMVWLS